MIKSKNITIQWGDGEYPFALNIGQARELEAKQGTGICAIYNRIVAGEWYIDDIYHIIRLGLIGGGMSPPDALRLVNIYVSGRPFSENQLIARAVLYSAFFDEDAGKDQVAGNNKASQATE